MKQTLTRERLERSTEGSASIDRPAAGQARVDVEYFTDPLCCWSWAFEPQWRRLRFEYGPLLSWRYRMGGMIGTWNGYHDPVNSISRPSQMGPLWYQVRELSGMPLEDRIWFEDPPQSSYPACSAVKAAELQSAAAAEAYLRRLREAVMIERRNIARADVLLEVAAELAEDEEILDGDQFADDLNGSRAQEALREDIRVARYLEIGRFPTLILRRQGEQKGLLLVGYRPYDAVRAALEHVDGDMEPVRVASSQAEYKRYWGRILERELKELPAAR